MTRISRIDPLYASFPLSSPPITPVQLARDLFQRGVCPLVHDGVGLTAMDYVCILDLPNLVPFLLAALDSYFASPEYLENWRSVPFSSSDYPLTLEDYLNQARYKHWTVLTLAACCGALKICEMLVATGYIDLEALGGCGYSAVCCAIKCALRAEKQLQQSMQNRLNTSAGVKQDAGGAVVAQRRMRDRAMSALATEAFRQEEEWYQRTYGNRGNARTSISGTNRSTIAAGAGAAATTTATMIGATQTSNVTTQTSNVTTRAMAARHRAAANADKDSMSNHNTALPSSSSSSSSTTTTTTTSSSSNSSDMPGSTQRRRRMFPSRAVANEGGADGDDDDDDASASMEVEMTELDVRRRSAQHGAGLAPTRVGWGNIDQNGDMDGHDVRDGGDDGDDDGNWDSLDMRYMKPAARSGSNPSESFGSSSSSSSSSASSSSSSSSSSSARDVALATQMESKRVDDGDNAYGNAHGMDDRHYPTQQQRKSSLNDMMQGGFDDKGDDTMRGDDGMGESGSMDSTAVPTDVTEPTPLTHSEEELRAIKQQKDGWAIVTLLIGAGARPRIIRRFLPLPQAGQEAVQAGLFLQHRGRVSEFVDLLVAAGTAEAKVAMERVARHIADNIMSPRSAWTEASSTSVTQWPVEVLNLVAAYGCVPHVDDIDPRTGDVTWGKYCTAEARPPLLMGSGATGAGNPRAEVIDDDIPPMFKALLPCNDTCACHCHCRFCSDP